MYKILFILLILSSFLKADSDILAGDFSEVEVEKVIVSLNQLEVTSSNIELRKRLSKRIMDSERIDLILAAFSKGGLRDDLSREIKEMEPSVFKAKVVLSILEGGDEVWGSEKKMGSGRLVLMTAQVCHPTLAFYLEDNHIDWDLFHNTSGRKLLASKLRTVLDKEYPDEGFLKDSSRKSTEGSIPTPSNRVSIDRVKNEEIQGSGSMQDNTVTENKTVWPYYMAGVIVSFLIGAWIITRKS